MSVIVSNELQYLNCKLQSSPVSRVRIVTQPHNLARAEITSAESTVEFNIPTGV